MTCENYENHLRARTLSNCTCRECEALNIAYVERSAVNEKAFQEMLHRTKVRLLKKEVERYLKTGIEDTEHRKFSEMLGNEKPVYCRMITISLPQTDYNNIPEIVKKVNKYIHKWKFIQAPSQWAYEQRGDSDETRGQGLHVHIITPFSKKPPHEIVRDIATPLKIERNFVHVKRMPIDAAEKYLFEQKTDKQKHLKQYHDNIMRQELNLEQKYIKNY